MASSRFGRGSGDRRRVADVWLSLKMTAAVFAQISMLGLAVLAVISLATTGDTKPPLIFFGLPVVWLSSLWFLIRVWNTYHEGIVVDATTSTLTFPASDVENSVVDILTCRRFFDHARRESVRLGAIEILVNETRARQGHYAVNISGPFGSRQFLFDSKQKRDEFRAAIEWGLKENGFRAKQDNNPDVGGYGA